MRALLSLLIILSSFSTAFAYKIGEIIIVENNIPGVVFHVDQENILLVGINEVTTSWTSDATPSNNYMLPKTTEYAFDRLTGKNSTLYLQSLSSDYNFPFLKDIGADKGWFLPSLMELKILIQNHHYINPILKDFGDTIVPNKEYLTVNEQYNNEVYTTTKNIYKKKEAPCRPMYQISNKTLPIDWKNKYKWNTGDTIQQIKDTPKQTGIYSVTVTNSENGCQATANKKVVVLDEEPKQEIYDTICNGETYDLFGIVASESGDYTSSIDIDGCKSSILLHLTVAPKNEITFEDEICFGECYNKNGFTVTPFKEGVFTDTVKLVNHFGCDSILFLKLKVNPIAYDTITKRICQSVGYKDDDFDIQPYKKVGLHYFTTDKTTDNGCKLFHSLALQVDSVYKVAMVADVYKGDSYQNNGFDIKELQESSIYTLNLKTILGCDSTVNLSINVIDTTPPVHVTAITEAICEGETYKFNGKDLTLAGIYTDTTQTDTTTEVTELTLAVNPVYYIEVFDTLCGKTGMTDETSEPVVLKTLLGCDSTVVHKTHYNQPLTTKETKTICAGDSYKWNNKTLTEAGLYNVTLTSSTNCDSIVELDLKVAEPVQTTLTKQICEGSSYHFKNTDLTKSGTYRDTLASQFGCDSIVVLNLTVADKVIATFEESICEGKKYQFGKLQLSTAGIYNDTTTSKLGCDSITQLNLSVHPVYNLVVYDTLCAETNKADEDFEPVLYQTMYGCDSTVIRKVHYNKTLTTKETKTICAGDSYKWNNKTLTKAGLYNITFTSSTNCDSIVELDLKVAEPEQTTLTKQICEGSSYHFKNTDLTKSGTYRDTLASQFGCDSIVILNLTVADKVITTLEENICEGKKYQFGKLQLSTAGIYNDTTTSKLGCDSITQLNLNVHPVYNLVVYDTLCAETNKADEVFESVPYKTMYGCDSSIVRKVHYNKTLTTKETKTICAGDSYKWNNKTLTKAGLYNITLTSSSNCDSIVELDLKVAKPEQPTITKQICKGSSYHFKNTDLTKSGTYRDTLASQFGCDSIVVLNLTVVDKVTTILEESICEGETYVFGERTLNKPGSYTDTLTSIAGCDSIVKLKLRVKKTISISVKDTTCEGEAYEFAGESKKYQPGTEKIAAHLTSIDGCDSLVNLTLTIMPVGKATIYDTSMVGENYVRNGFELGVLGKPGNREQKLRISNEVGCDSIITLHLYVRPLADDHTVPTVFSPYNQDGNNDIFMEGYEVYIYDRYGNMICHSKDGWDGKYRGEFADPGVYVYIVRMKDGKRRRGTIEVLKN